MLSQGSSFALCHYRAWGFTSALLLRGACLDWQLCEPLLVASGRGPPFLRHLLALRLVERGPLCNGDRREPCIGCAWACGGLTGVAGCVEDVWVTVRCGCRCTGDGLRCDGSRWPRGRRLDGLWTARRGAQVQSRGSSDGQHGSPDPGDGLRSGGTRDATTDARRPPLRRRAHQAGARRAPRGNGRTHAEGWLLERSPKARRRRRGP